MNEYRPADYWRRRYQDFDIVSSGHRDLPLAYNTWLYKMKTNKIGRAASRHFTDFSQCRVMALGCGSGVYVDMWKNFGVQELTGLDIAPNAIDQLSKIYPGFSFFCEDLSSEDLADRYGEGVHDLVTAVGVLVHIIDDELFRQAVANISKLTREDGMVLVSDYVVRKGLGIEKTHMKLRSLPWFQKVFADAGLELVEEVPLYFFMIEPFDTQSFRGRPRIHSLLVRMIHRFPGLTGGLLYGVDSLLTHLLKSGPSEKLFIYRKK